MNGVFLSDICFVVLSKRLLYLLCIVIVSGSFSGCSPPETIVRPSFSISGLAVEYNENPLGIDIEQPRFSWRMEANEDLRGVSQSAYRIKVTDSRGVVAWDTQQVTSDASVGITYAGVPLQPATRYNWSVTVWDHKGGNATASSWFETGLMGADDDTGAWEGAEWIGGGPEDLVFYSHTLSVFKLAYTLQLDQESGSTRAGFVFGANDSRLMERDKNIYNIESARNESYIKFELDISNVDGSKIGLACFNIYRVGYHPDDQVNVPFKSYAVPLTLIHNGNKHDPHHIYAQCVLGVFDIFLDGTDEAHELTRDEGQNLGPFSSGGVNLNPVGRGGDYISFPLLADIGFFVLAEQKAGFSNIEITNYRSPSNVLFEADLVVPASETDTSSMFLTGAEDSGNDLTIENGTYVLEGGPDGTFLTVNPSRNSMPMLRRSFAIENKEIDRARLYVTARGIYEIYINGRRVGVDWFNPGLTQYNATHMYQTYDVTDLVHAGQENAIGAMLGEGWWSGHSTFVGSNWNYFGDRQSLLAKLVITYRDGTTKVVGTNDQDWKYYNKGPVIYGSFFQGEVYDATREAAVAGWSEPDFDHSTWKPAVVVPLEGTAFLGLSAGLDGVATDFNYDKFILKGQIGPNARVVKTLTAKSMEEVRPGVFVYDMGQNMVGVPRISISEGAPGQRITLRYAEVRYPDLPEYGENIGMIMLENIRAALSQDIYLLKEGEEIIQPRFTFHGYRFVEITGIDKALPLEAVQGLVISSIGELTASYETSNPKVNRLWKNITWSTLGNFLSIPTDCPQRNERMGWSGDISVFSRTATYVADVDRFLARHLMAMRDLQRENGWFPDIAPIGNGFGGILWGSAGITVAWEAYQQYDDTGLLRDHYEAMKRYVEYLSTRIDPDTGVVDEGPLGDWLSPEGGKNDNSLLWCAYYVCDLGILTKVAEALEEFEDAEEFRREYEVRKKHFNDTYVDPETGKTVKSRFKAAGFWAPPGEGSRAKAPVAFTSDGREFVDTQASYAVPLALGVFSQENIPRAAEHLAAACTRQSVDNTGAVRPEYSLMTGFIGTAWVSKALSVNGYSDVAYRLLQQDSYPSWLYPVDQGATTIWERLNSYTVEKGFGGNNSMNSFNHYSFGAVGQWMMANSLGIQRDEKNPGFKHFLLKPEPDPTGQMTWARGFYDSMYGRIRSAWEIGDGALTYRATVPANTTATLYLPVTQQSTVMESGIPAPEAEGVEFLEYENGRSIYRLTSGEYEFQGLQ